jgi:hypothetical protein
MNTKMNTKTNEAGYEDFDGSNFSTFKLKLLSEARPIGELVVKLCKGLEYKRNRPTINDTYMEEDDETPSTMRKYDTTSAGDISAEGKKGFRDDMRMYDLQRAKDKLDRATFLALLLKRCTATVHSCLAAYRDVYQNALDTNDYFVVWNLLESSYSSGNTAVILKNVVKLTQIQQGKETHEEYLEKFNTMTKQVAKDFHDEDHPGYIKNDQLFGILYIAGLDKEFFQHKIEAAYDKYPDGKINDVQKLTQEFQLYNLQKVDIKTTIKTEPNNKSLTTKEEKRKCACGTTFVAHEDFYTRCRDCQYKFKNDKTPEQMLANVPPEHPDVTLWANQTLWMTDLLNKDDDNPDNNEC